MSQWKLVGRCAAAAACALGLGAAHAATETFDSLVNGVYGSGAGSISGWTVSSGTVDVLGGNGSSADNYLVLNDGDAIQYSFNAGGLPVTVAFDFYYSKANTNGSSVATVSLDGMHFALGNTPGGGNPGASNADSYHYSLSGVSMGPGPHSLTFSYVSNNASNFRVDDVSVTVTAVPEPETYAMLLAGLGVLATVGRRRKR